MGTDWVWLIPLRDLDADARAIQLGAIADMSLLPGQERFVGDPLRMALAGLAGWPDESSAWLLRGFLIDSRHQGKGLGTLAATAAVEAARKLTARHQSCESGVVLSVNEENHAGLSAYRRAGFVDAGPYLGGSAGPQRTMFHSFAAPAPA